MQVVLGRLKATCPPGDDGLTTTVMQKVTVSKWRCLIRQPLTAEGALFIANVKYWVFYEVNKVVLVVL